MLELAQPFFATVNYGVAIYRSPVTVSAWRLQDIQISTSENLSGSYVEFLLQNHIGLPAVNVDVLLCWNNWPTVTQTDQAGRARLRLWNLCDPDQDGDLYRASIVDASDEVSGLASLLCYSTIYKLFYSS